MGSSNSTSNIDRPDLMQVDFEDLIEGQKYFMHDVDVDVEDGIWAIFMGIKQIRKEPFAVFFKPYVGEPFQLPMDEVAETVFYTHVYPTFPDFRY